MTPSTKKNVIRILHVDDDFSIQEISKQILMDIDDRFNIDHASCVDDALKKLSTIHYDVVVSDYDMPQKNGLQFLKELRKEKNNIPFILFTGKGREEVVIEALNLGADHYVNKQGSPEAVYSELAHLVSSAVEKSHAKLKNENDSLAFQNVHEAIVSSDANFVITAWNKAAEELFGFSSQEILQKKIVDFFERIQVKPTFDELMHQLKTTGQFQGEIVYQNKKGELRSGDLHIVSISTENGKFRGNVAICSDITERKKTEVSLKESEEKFRKLAEDSPNMIFINQKGRVVYANKKCEDTMGYSKEEFYSPGFNFLSIIAPESIELLKSSYAKHMGDEEVSPYEYRLVTKDGQRIEAIITSKIIEYNAEKAILGLVTDITERKRNEETLRQSEEQFRQLFSNMPSGVAIYEAVDNGQDFVFRDFNAAAEKIEKIDKETIRGKRLTQVFTGVKSFGIFEVFQRVWRTGQPEYYPIALYKDDKDPGSWRENWVYKLPNGHIIAIYNDITENKKLEVALQEKLDMLEALTDNIGAGFVTISKDYRVLYANKFVKNNVGNMEGKLCYASLNTLDHVCPDCGVRKVFEDHIEKDSHEYSQIGIDGKRYHIELIATPLRDKDGNITKAVELIVDIGEKKRMQQKLEANEAKFRAISDSAIDAIFMFNEEDEIIYWNPAAERIFGYKTSEIINEKVNGTIVPPHFCNNYLSLIAKLARTENKNATGEILEILAWRKDKTEFLIELSITSLRLNSKQLFVAIARDVTERKKAEEKVNQMVDQLVLVNEKLGVVGSLTRHDVRNKLSAITGYSYLLKKKHCDLSDVVKGLSKMEQAVCESVRIFDFAKMYEQLGVEDLEYIDVEAKLKEACSLFSGVLPKISNECQGLKLLADSFLRQLFYNFIDNTRKHGKKAKAIRVYYEKADEQDILKLVYEDNGIGVSWENKPHLFQEGFSTGGTTGFGLFLTKKMIDIYGWEIQENGEPGKGAKFTISIPKLNKNNRENFQFT